MSKEGMGVAFSALGWVTRYGRAQVGFDDLEGFCDHLIQGFGLPISVLFFSMILNIRQRTIVS